MLDLEQIGSFYPESLRPFKRNLLREYLQYKILEALFSSSSAEKLSFMGGTAVHIVHSINRFSEDLDFDNMGLGAGDFKDIAGIVGKRLRLEGYEVEITHSFKGAYRAYINFPGILHEYKLSAHPGEKLMIQIDAEPQRFVYKPGKAMINKFDVFCSINVVPIDILLAQKIYAIFMRKRAMGRDFYDAIYLLGKTKPNYEYLRVKVNIKDKDDLKEKLLMKCEKIDMGSLAKDVQPFLFIPSDAKKILLFPEYINSLR